MSAASVSAGAAMARVSGRPIDTGSRGASSDQGPASDFPDLMSKMASAENPPSQRAATAIPERRGNWGPSTSVKANTQSDAKADAEAALAALLSGECGSVTCGTDQTSATPMTVAPPDDAAGASDNSAIPDWQGMFQAQGFVAMGIGAAQSAAIAPDSTGAAPRPGMDAATLMQLAKGAQAAAMTAPHGSQAAQQAMSPARDWSGAASQIITAVAQETHISTGGPGAPSSVAQATPMPVPQDADEAPGAQSGGQNAGAPINPGSSALIQATSVAQVRSMRSTERGADRASSANPGDGADAMPPERIDQHTNSSGPVRTIGPATGKVARPTMVPPDSAVSGSPRPATGDRGDGIQSASAAPVSEHATSASYEEVQHLSGAIPTPAHQVASQIVSVTEAVKSDAAAPLGTVTATPAATASVVRVLRLELQPADLGTITIRMSLKEDGLDIRVEASRSDTARMLQQDQDSLAKMLTGAGYRIDGMTVVSAPAHGGAATDGGSQMFQSSSMLPQQGGAPPQPDSRSSGDRQDPQSDSRSPPSRQDNDNDKSRSARGPGSDLYV